MDNDVFWGSLNIQKKYLMKRCRNFIAKIIAGEYNSLGYLFNVYLASCKNAGKTSLSFFERICYLLIDNECLLENYLLGASMSKNLLRILELILEVYKHYKV